MTASAPDLDKLDQRFTGHLCRLWKSHHFQQSRRYVGQSAILGQSCVTPDIDEGYEVCCMLCVRLMVDRIHHHLDISMVGRDDDFCADLLSCGDDTTD